MVIEDNLVEGRTPSGLIIVNHGDPAFQRKASEQGLAPAEALFLRLLSYLTFAEVISIPSRYLLESAETAQAMAWAEPLLKEGIIAPERRADVASFSELATVRSLPEIALHRAEFLDRVTKTHRSFRWDALSSTYKAILDTDLHPGGAFRKTLRGGQAGNLAHMLDAAAADHLENGDGTPEQFEASVRRAAPSLARAAKRWAMARYYITPTAFDTANTRELPEHAAKLLSKGGVIDAHQTHYEFAEPAAMLYAQLSASLPAHQVSVLSKQYCEALLTVRQRLPEARRVFSDVSERSHLAQAGESVSRLMREELDRQQRIRKSSGRVYSLGAGLMTTAAGTAMTAVLAGSAEATVIVGGLGVGGSVAVNEIQKKREARKKKRQQPWILAIDEMTTRRPQT